MSRVFWDTNLFIYLFEGQPHYSNPVKALLAKILHRGDQLFTTALSVGEILAKPYERGEMERCSRYEQAIRESAVILNFDLPAARHFARIRAEAAQRVRPPDAIQLACAASARVDLFLTNDTRLHNLTINGIQFITSVERAPL